MSEKRNAVVLERHDPARNMARFYVLRIEPSLFGDPTLIREWGRLGQRGRQRIDIHETEERAAQALESWLHRKQRRGYRMRGAEG